MGTPRASIVICSLDRPKALAKCLNSLARQSVDSFETKIIREKGELASLRNKGAQGAKGKILIFIDDDTYCPSYWLYQILRPFQEKVGIVGVSGPAIIPIEYKNNRDLFRYSYIKLAYDYLFLEGKADLPGHFTKAGAWTTGASEATCNYEGEVHFLEACNMAWKRETFEKIGGFDESYRGIGDWSEPDLAFRMRKEGKLWFNPRARLYHLPDKTGAYLSRERTGARLSNYYQFSRKWIKPCLRHTLYKVFLRSYYGLKELKVVLGH